MTKVYRVVRADEDPAQGLRAKNPAARYALEGHILHGSRPGFASQYISATANITVARRWAGLTGCRIVEIDLQKVAGRIIDLGSLDGRDRFLKGVTAKKFAEAAAEVVIEGNVPADAVQLIE